MMDVKLHGDCQNLIASCMQQGLALTLALDGRQRDLGQSYACMPQQVNIHGKDAIAGITQTVVPEPCLPVCDVGDPQRAGGSPLTPTDPSPALFDEAACVRTPPHCA